MNRAGSLQPGKIGTVGLALIGVDAVMGINPNYAGSRGSQSKPLLSLVILIGKSFSVISLFSKLFF